MCCIPWCYAFCCEPRRLISFYKRKNSRRHEHTGSTDSSDNARVVEEKRPRDAERRKRRSHGNTTERRSHNASRGKRRKSPSSSSDANPAFVPAVVIPPPPPAGDIDEAGPEASTSPAIPPSPPIREPTSPHPSAAASAHNERPETPPLSPPSPVPINDTSTKPVPPRPPKLPLSPTPATVVTHQELSNQEAGVKPLNPSRDPTSKYATVNNGNATNKALQKHPEAFGKDTLYRRPPPVPRSHVDVEIFATPSERRRQRSVSRVRSESSRRRSSSRPRSSHSTNVREFRDSYQSFYSDGSRRGDESDGSMPSIPPVPMLDRDRSVYVDQTRRKRRSQPHSPGTLIRLVPGMGPEPNGLTIDRPREQYDPDLDFKRNIESPERNTMREEELMVRKCSRRERREQEEERMRWEQEERMRWEQEERMRWEQEERMRWEQEERTKREREQAGLVYGADGFQEGPPTTSEQEAKTKTTPGQLNITITRTTTVRRKQRTPESSSNSSPSTSQSDSLSHLPSGASDTPSHHMLELVQEYRKKPKPKIGFAYIEDGPLPVTYKEHRDSLSSHIVEKGLEAVIPADSMDTIEIARRAEAEADRICASLGISPYGTPDLTKIGLYDIIVFCDDSESMLKGNRFDDQKSIVQRISRIAQTYNRSGISLRFINFQDDEGYNHLNHGEINSVISNVFPEGSTKLGTKLLEKVLFPFVLNPAKRMELRKPVLISIITDGEPTEEDIDTLKYTILATKRELGKFVNARGLPYGRSAVTFQINRIGDSPDSKRYLERLSSDPELSSLIFCNDETLDAAVREAGPDSGALNTWLTQLLAGAVKV